MRILSTVQETLHKRYVLQRIRLTNHIRALHVLSTELFIINWKKGTSRGTNAESGDDNHTMRGQ